MEKYPFSFVSYVPYEKEEIEKSVPERFKKIAMRFPGRIAVKADDKIFTYKELDKVSDDIANAILFGFGTHNEPFFLLFEHGAEVIPSIIGVLKAGKSYVAADPSFPCSKLTDILEDVQAAGILTNRKHYALAAELASEKHQIITTDEIGSEFSLEEMSLSISPDTHAAVFYTSGSGGQPKGIIQNHRQILHHALITAKNYRICIEDRQALLPSYTFTGSVPDIFCTLLQGASLYPYDVWKNTVSDLVRWLIRQKITVCHPPVTLFRQFSDILTTTGKEYFPELRVLRLGGQGLNSRDFNLFKKCFSENCILSHSYSSTETSGISIFSANHRTVANNSILPGGYPVEDKEIRILNENGQQLGFDEVGEIAIRSRYLSPGYWRNPELTAQKFLPDPEGGDKRIYLTGDLGRMKPDGCLEILGRKDFQVKIRGYRVQTEAVESALHSLESVKDAAVKAFDHLSGEKYLTAYIVPDLQFSPTVSALRKALSEKLPEYMIPSVFVMMEKLPLTTTGKTDRSALPEPSGIRPALDAPFVPPSSEEEKQIAEIWAEILELDQVGIHDSFFDLGGNSIQSMRIVSRICRVFHTDLSMSVFFDFPTVAGLAAYITEKRDSSISDTELEKLVAELEMLSDEEAEQLLDGSPPVSYGRPLNTQKMLPEISLPE
ncbi:MAG: non-ribosomal peptide synthetase [Desulfococcaceae bacterium]|jgi:amino acid adenylation domain-containing protein|nr:non-ribosomal peptide synthetase [Desulfococcaceae bacterium]